MPSETLSSLEKGDILDSGASFANTISDLIEIEFGIYGPRLFISTRSALVGIT
jgi:hypothetical protein